MRKRITIQEAEVLLDRYYEGLTSGEEEKSLFTFLSQKNLPEQFNADKALLNYFDSQKKKRKTGVIPLMLRVGSIAASVLVGIMIVHLLLPGKPGSYAYIDGKKITNMEQVKEQAFESIQSWNNSDKNTNLNTDEIINQQLQLFTE